MFIENLLRFIYCYYRIYNKYKYLELYVYRPSTNKKWKSFSIYKKDLSNIPEYIYELHITRLHNLVSKIENINDKLLKLNLSYTKVSKIENLNESLITLNLSHTKI